MTDIDMFSSMLNWKLKRGSHEFPGKDGGTCVNEAAIVAAGLPYCAVSEAADLPECFSRVVGEFALVLNDTMPARIRQSLLMPFVLRLAGTADSEAMEDWRSAFIVTECVRTVLTMGLNHDCAYLLKFNPQSPLVHQLRQSVRDDHPEHAVPIGKVDKRRAMFELAQMANALDVLCPTDTVTAAGIAACIRIVGRTSQQPTSVYRRAVDILDRAIRMGRHDEIPVEQAAQRLQTAKAKQFEVS